MGTETNRAVIVEDSSQMRELIKMALRSSGITDITEAENGADAIDLIKSRGADIVIMDWMMDVMDGMECTRQIRAGIEGVDPKTPIILLTGMVSEESEAAAYAAGADLFMGKPFSLKQMFNGVMKILRDQQCEAVTA